jgi:hypothetical protein
VYDMYSILDVMPLRVTEWQLYGDLEADSVDHVNNWLD